MSATLKANRKYPNTNGWQDRHDRVIEGSYVNGFEQAISQMLKAWQTYAQSAHHEYGSKIGEDGVLGSEWEQIGLGIRGLLNGSLGRLDAGTLDAFILDALQENGCNTENL